MTKLKVMTRDGQQGEAPFLRGILTRSLQDAGLAFDDAYALASAIRDELSDIEEVTTEQLREVVSQHLSDDHADVVLRRYQAPNPEANTVLVREYDGSVVAFSREQHRRHVETSGLSYEESMDVTMRISQHLLKRSMPEVAAGYLGMLTYRYLSQVKGKRAATRYLVLVDHLRGRRPLLLLIGGTAGSGKSTVATDLAHRLEIGRTQSTDLLREVMRMMLPERLLPVLHASSFNAWWVLPGKNEPGYVADSVLTAGFQAQAELVSVACEAVIRRSLTESTSLVLEGVHVGPPLLANIPKDSDAVVVPLMLAVLGRTQLRERISRRGDQSQHRRAGRYLENFDAIWDLQSFLLSEADRWGLPIIRNDNIDQTVQDCTKTVLDYLSRGFSKSPFEVFKAQAWTEQPSLFSDSRSFD